MILVTGATGKVGSELVRRLKEKGESFRVMVRTAEQVEKFQARGIGTVLGDFEHPETFLPALTGVERAFLLSPAGPHQVEQQGAFVDAAVLAEVKHLVKLSALGAAPSSPLTLGRWHGATEQKIEASGLAWTHLRPHFFSQNLLQFASLIRAQGAFFVPGGEAEIPPIDVRDIADVAAIALTEDGHAGKAYTLTGPEDLSFAAMAEKLAAALGRPVRYVDVPPAGAKQGMMGAGLPEWMADALLELYALYRSGQGSGVSPDVETVTGHPALSFDDFARDHAATFQG